MKNRMTDQARIFNIKGVDIKDFGKILLDDNEMISLKTTSNKEYDIVSKSWGFYATPSMNSRLKKEGFKTALVVNETNQVYVMMVEEEKLSEFKLYLKTDQDNRLICWLDEWFKEEV